MKTCLISQDSIMTLSKEKVPVSHDLIRQAADHLQELSDILSDVHFTPYIWYGKLFVLINS